MQPDKHMVSLYVFFGLIASGKSTLAEAFSCQYGFPYFNTDRVRKELAGLEPVSRQPDAFNQGIYSKEFSRKTYQAMLDLIAVKIRSGHKGVVLDGSYSSMDERARVLAQAKALDARCIFIQCVCSDKVVRDRLEIRAQDLLAVSDGRWEIYLAQKESFQSPSELEPSQLITLETARSVVLLLEDLATILDLQ